MAKLLCSTAGVANLRTAGRMQPSIYFSVARRGGAKGVLGGATAPPETLSAPPVGVLREFKVYLEYIVFVLNRITSLLQYTLSGQKYFNTLSL